ncbi:MAG: DUF2834 domain-containing protein [Candidatus Binatia bacterium]
MSKKQQVIAFVLVSFTALSTWILAQYGFSYIGFLRDAHSTLAGVQVLLDLVIALTLFLVWMWNDARRRDISPLPYLIATLFLGSIGALLYLLRTGASAAPEAARRGVPATAR